MPKERNDLIDREIVDLVGSNQYKLLNARVSR